jgi:hypothetical protein
VINLKTAKQIGHRVELAPLQNFLLHGPVFLQRHDSILKFLPQYSRVLSAPAT